MIQWARYFSMVLCVLVSFSTNTQAREFEQDYDEKPWEEIVAQIPPFPVDEDWVEYRINSLSGNRVFVDVKTLSLGSDGVVRFSLLVLSNQGAKNISYEGMRCLTGERRLYAFGRSDSTWSKARNNQWVKIIGDTNNHRVDLFSTLFCQNGAVPFRNDDDVRRALRAGSPALWLR